MINRDDICARLRNSLRNFSINRLISAQAYNIIGGDTMETDNGGAHILIVEDNPSARNLAVRMLSSLGYIVTAAKDAAEAITVLNKGQHFDVLFTDIIMPGAMDGIDLARMVRARDANIKILFTSGFSNMGAEEALNMDATYVAKPYRKIEIAKMLHSLLKTSD